MDRPAAEEAAGWRSPVPADAAACPEDPPVVAGAQFPSESPSSVCGIALVAALSTAGAFLKHCRTPSGPLQVDR